MGGAMLSFYLKILNLGEYTISTDAGGRTVLSYYLQILNKSEQKISTNTYRLRILNMA